MIFNLTKDSFKFLDPRLSEKDRGKLKRESWFNDQYKNPKESIHTYSEILNWFNDAGIEFVSSIPFSFSDNLLEKKLFDKQKKSGKLEMLYKEILQSISYRQIKEGGFFIMIGKKK